MRTLTLPTIRMKVLIAVAMALGVLAAATQARADDRTAAREHFIKGSKDFDLGLYDDAIKEYMAAYEVKSDPALLYNIAQAHRLAGRASEALRFYKMFLVKVPDAANGDEVRAKIAELQKLIDQQKKTQTMPPDQIKPLGSTPPPPRSTAPSTTPGTTAAAPTSIPAVPVQAPTPIDLHPGRTEKIAGLTVTAVGVAALVTGTALSAIAKSDSDDLSAIDMAGGVWDPAKDSTGRALALVGPLLIGVGAAAAVTGGIVTILGVRKAKRARETAVSLAPSLSPRMVGTTMKICF